MFVILNKALDHARTHFTIRQYYESVFC